MSASGDMSVAGAAAGGARPWDSAQRRAAFAAARRHTRFVRLLRKALPLACAAVLVGIVVLARASAPEGLDLSIARTTISNGAVVMHEPRLTGYDEAHRSYRVSAETASQKLTRPDQVELTKVAAEIQAPDRGEITITAGAGNLDNGEDRLSLHDGVEVESADGYRILLEDVVVHFKERRLASDRPVTIIYEEGRTTADRLRVTDGGKLVVLEGRVRTIYRAPNDPSAGLPVADALGGPGQVEAVR